MGRRLSLLCCPCLPRKQRDNLSSRSLYPDQDSGQEDYSDEDDAFPSSGRRQSRLESLGQHQDSEYNRPYTKGHPPPAHAWPSSFSSGHFPRQSTRTHTRKPNPFRAYRDDDDEEDSQAQQGQEDGEEGDEGDLIVKHVPYHDDSDTDDQAGRASKQDQNALNDPSTVHRLTHPGWGQEVKPYRLDSAQSGMRRPRQPRNPQGKMAWEEDDEEDAEEVIDVDALIQEQERITRELAAQEEALRQEEEAAILKKRLAAIRAAERRGLLRFEGDELVLSSSSDAGQEQHGKPIPSLSKTAVSTSSGASSFVGGIDAFNQELKMMTFAVEEGSAHVHDTDRMAKSSNTSPRHVSDPVHKAGNGIVTPTTSSLSSTATITTTTLTPTATTTASPAKPVSVAVSTATTTNQSSINPREVLSNITSFLKKVDGVIAGESSSSDEASFSDQEQALSKKNRSHSGSINSTSNISTSASSTLRRKHSNGPQAMLKGSYSTTAATETTPSTTTTTVVVHLPANDLYPEDPFNTPTVMEDGDHYPADPFNHTLSESIVPETKDEIKKEKEKEKEQPKITTPPPVHSSTATGNGHYNGIAAAAPERIYNTFTSIFNTGSSIMGYFSGAAAVSPPGDVHGSEDDSSGSTDPDDDLESHRRRRSNNAKYGNPQTHVFDYREHQAHLEAAKKEATVTGSTDKVRTAHAVVVDDVVAGRGRRAVKDEDDDDDDDGEIDYYDF